MTVTTKNRHVYGITGPLGEPLFEIDVFIHGRPYLRLESCTKPGTLRRHYFKYPLKGDDPESTFRVWMLQEVDSAELPALYTHLAQSALRSMAQRPRQYSLSVAHKMDAVKRFNGEGYLTGPQREAMDRLAGGDKHPWAGTRALEEAQKQIGIESPPVLSDAYLQPDRLAFIQECIDRHGFEFHTMETNLFLTAPLGKDIHERVVPRNKAAPGTLKALSYAHYYCTQVDKSSYFPADIEIYIAWPVSRRRRCIQERLGKAHRARPYNNALMAPYFPETEDAHLYADTAEHLPSNWDDLSYEMQFDQDIPPQYLTPESDNQE